MSNEITTYDLSSPSKTLALATELGKFIKERNLTTNIKGKDYVNVEGWQFAGSQLGIVPILKELTDLSQDTEKKYRATIELRRISDDRLVGMGIAICSNKEAIKRNFEEYAIASMAQTRASGKAFRMLLSWLMKAAGYETTPAEEAEGYERGDMPTEDEKDILRKMVYSTSLTDEKKAEAHATIDGCRTYPLYAAIQGRLESLQQAFDTIENPSQKQINKELKKNVQNGIPG